MSEETGICLDEAGTEEVLESHRFEKVEGTSCKFYEIEVVRVGLPGNLRWEVETAYGSMKAGAHVTRKSKTYTNVYSAIDDCRNIRRTRLDHGYKEVK